MNNQLKTQIINTIEQSNTQLTDMYYGFLSGATIGATMNVEDIVDDEDREYIAKLSELIEQNKQIVEELKTNPILQ